MLTEIGNKHRNILKQDAFVKHECPRKGHFFLLILILIIDLGRYLDFGTKGFYPKEYICEI